jgi:hypothetical protein
VVAAAAVASLGMTNTGTDSAAEWSPGHIGEPNTPALGLKIGDAFAKTGAMRHPATRSTIAAFAEPVSFANVILLARSP